MTKEAAFAKIADHVRDLRDRLILNAFPLHAAKHHAAQKSESENCGHDRINTQPQYLVIGRSTANLTGCLDQAPLQWSNRTLMDQGEDVVAVIDAPSHECCPSVRLGFLQHDLKEPYQGALEAD